MAESVDNATPMFNKIKELETQYGTLNEGLKEAVARVHANEHSIVICLQTLMPLQHGYLTGIINNLQKQVTQLQLEQQQYKANYNNSNNNSNNSNNIQPAVNTMVSKPNETDNSVPQRARRQSNDSST